MRHPKHKACVRNRLFAALTVMSSAASLPVAHAQGAAQEKRTGVSFAEVSLGALPRDDKGELFSEIAVAPDNMRYASIDKGAGGERIIVNGFLNDLFDKIAGGGLSGPALAFSKQGGRMAYLGIKGNQVYPVVDGVTGQALAGSKAPFLTFSEDGKRLAFTIQNQGKQYNVIDGKQTPLYDEAGYVRFSPNGQRCLYWAKTNGREMVVLDGVPGKAHEGITNIVWSPDSEHYAYQAKDLGRSRVVLDGIEGATYLEVGGSITLFDPLVFSSTGVLVYAAQNADGPLVVLDGVEKGPLPEVGALARSPDGKRIAVGLATPQRYMMVVDSFGQAAAGAPLNPEPKPYPFVSHSTIRFSPDSRRVAFIATLKRGEELTAFTSAPDTEAVVLDGVEQASYPAPNALMVSEFNNEIVFSPDSRRIASLSRSADKKQRVVLDGRAGAAYDRIGFRLNTSTISFSPDSRHMAYLVESKGKSYLVVDGQESAAYDGFVSTSRIAWHASDRLSIIGHRAGTIYRVTATMTP